MVKTTLLAFLNTGLGVWLPWVVWSATETYVLGRHDPKFVNDNTAFFLVAIVWGALAFLSAISALFVYAIKEQAILSLSAYARFVVPFTSGLILSAASYVVMFEMPTPLWANEMLFIALVWIAISVFVSRVSLFVYQGLSDS